MSAAFASFSLAISRFAIVVTLLLCVGVTSLAEADELKGDSPDVIYRQTLMDTIGSNMGAIGDIMKNRLDLPGHIAIHAGEMAESAQMIASAFKKNAPSEMTDAQPKIWTDWTEFESAIADFEKAARNLQTAASGKDPSAVGPAMKALGKSCGGCHKPFRRPKEESFKNKLHK